MPSIKKIALFGSTGYTGQAILDYALKQGVWRHFATQTSAEVVLERLSGRHEGVVVLAFNRPAARNAISRSLLQATEDILRDLHGDSTLRVLILRSLVPGVFCAGADLKERATMSEREVGPFVDRLRNATTSLASVAAPTIAALDGGALGGGLELALACDLRVAASSAKMGLVETKLAIIPGAGGTQRLARVVGLGRAKEMILTGKVLDGTRAFEWGLVNEVVEQNAEGDAAYRAAEELAGRLATEAGPLALKLAKTALERGCELPLASGLELERACYAQVLPSVDRVEALRAFGEKRRPVYKGYEVTVLVRDPSRLPSSAVPSKAIQGDVLDRKDVEATVHGQDAVIVALGTRNDLAPTTVLSEGLKNVLAAMEKCGIKRISCIVSLRTCLVAFLFWERSKVPPQYRAITEDHERMFQALKASDAEWIAAFPPHIADEPARGDYILRNDAPVGRVISKRDLAEIMVKLLTMDQHVGHSVGMGYPTTS